MQNFPQDNDATLTLEKYNAHFSLNYENKNKKKKQQQGARKHTSPYTLQLTLTAPFPCMVMMLLGFLDS